MTSYKVYLQKPPLIKVIVNDTMFAVGRTLQELVSVQIVRES